MTIKISVRHLVENTMLSGSITSLGFGASKTAEGIKGHKVVQKSWGEGYTSEVGVSITVDCDELTLEIGGRIDGVYRDNDITVIEEIKTTDIPLEYIDKDSNRLHWAQGEIYSYIYAALHSIETVTLKLTYYNRETGKTLSFSRDYTFSDLKDFFDKTVNDYISWAGSIFAWSEFRDNSIKEACFPFKEYRRGQRSLASEVFKTLRDGGRLYVQAPTGTGKTIATIFPAVKALGAGLASKIFYLTAKTVTRSIVENALNIMYKEGLRLKSITLTAKEKMCFCPDVFCVPEECEYAKGYFDRLKSAVKYVFAFDRWDRETIEEYARRFVLCPFEFSLDLSIWADIIICDYNYVFDPRVHLKRFFADSGSDYAFLIDEAHNLVDRGREMYSASLCKSSFLNLSKTTKTTDIRITKSLKEINRYFIDLRRELEEERFKYKVSDFESAVLGIIPLLYKFTTLAQHWLEDDKPTDYREELIDLYFDCMSFLAVSEIYDERFITYIESEEKDIRLKMFCLDPSHLLRQCIDKGKGAVLFSATLSPLDYYRSLLGGKSDDNAIMLNSPFPEENLRLIVAGSVSTKYADRGRTKDDVADFIYAMACSKKGNYMAYFPSYKYLNDVFDRFVTKFPEMRVIVQDVKMSEEERSTFLEQFSENNDFTLVGFAVMGGVFGEGIDLLGDRLCGAAIVGVGLPQICPEREIIREYFQKTINRGFEYAYMYPGMNKVMQASGRVIRSETDKGIVLLIDERFTLTQYRKLFPKHWQHATYIKSPEMVF